VEPGKVTKKDLIGEERSKTARRTVERQDPRWPDQRLRPQRDPSGNEAMGPGERTSPEYSRSWLSEEMVYRRGYLQRMGVPSVPTVSPDEGSLALSELTVAAHDGSAHCPLQPEATKRAIESLQLRLVQQRQGR
jgi:hypothetical protein